LPVATAPIIPPRRPAVEPRALLATTDSVVADTMQALATPSRVLILGRLRAAPCSVSEPAGAIGTLEQAISHVEHVRAGLARGAARHDLARA
jgi:hypothetical protein